MHRTEIRLSRLLGGFTGTALVLTGLGVFATAALRVEPRTREIGVRKALGAGGWRIASLFAVEMGAMFAWAALAAVPARVWAAHRWLVGFPYRIEVSAGSVAAALALVLGMAGLAASQQLLRACRRDPVQALRGE